MKYTVIRVGFGENASSLARKYKTTERSLFLLNDNPLFFEGERLIAAEFHGKPASQDLSTRRKPSQKGRE